MAEARPVPARPGLGAPRARLAEILRVDHAGELAAVHIYRGQQAVFSAAQGKTALGEAFADLRAQEAEHLQAFDALLAERGGMGGFGRHGHRGAGEPERGERG